MTVESSTAASLPISLPPLSQHERRVLGVLVEKAKTTPDNYPLTLNGLITGCNQKSNREPVMTLGDAEVEEAIDRLKKLGFMQQIMGSGRTDKFRHVLYDALKVNKVELAILAELLLRGPQTEGELRGRASRMEPIEDLETLRTVLRGLAQRNLVVYLSPEGRRGTTVTHGFHTAGELERLRNRLAQEPLEETPIPSANLTLTSSAGAATGADERVQRLEERLQELETTVAVLQEELRSLQRQLAPLLGA
jgi:hypothetical protein